MTNENKARIDSDLSEHGICGYCGGEGGHEPGCAYQKHNETKHTPEPWAQSDEVENHGEHWEHRINGASKGTVARVTTTGVHGPNRKGEMYANAARIVACVNACRHYRTEQLEGKTFDPSHSELSAPDPG